MVRSPASGRRTERIGRTIRSSAKLSRKLAHFVGGLSIADNLHMQRRICALPPRSAHGFLYPSWVITKCATAKLGEQNDVGGATTCVQLSSNHRSLICGFQDQYCESAPELPWGPGVSDRQSRTKRLTLVAFDRWFRW